MHQYLNHKTMAFREKLAADMRTHFKQSKWEQCLHDQMVELLEMRPGSPYEYLQKKMSLRSKLDNTKQSHFLTELLIYCLFVDPLRIGQIEVENKILQLCVDKYQHSKIRRAEVINIINGLFLLANTQDKQKEHFLKLTGQQLEAESLNASHFTHVLYSAIVYLNMKQEIDALDEKLAELSEHLNWQILEGYLAAVTPANSLLKRMGVGADGDTGDLYKSIAVIANALVGEAGF